MPSLYILDTDHLSLLYRDSVEAVNIGRRIARIPDTRIAVSIISYEEQMRGWLSFSAQAKSTPQQIEAYRHLRKLVEQFRDVPLIDYDEKAAPEFERLVRERVRIGTMDLKIAAIALANGAVMLTRNRRDFEKVPDLQIEDWTV